MVMPSISCNRQFLVSIRIWSHSIMVSIAACHAVDRSSILLGTASFRRVWKWSSAWFHKPRTAGSNPATATSFRILSAIHITLLEIKQKRILLFLFRCSTAVVQLTVNQLVVGSIPATGAIHKVM